MRFFFLDEAPPSDKGAWRAPRELMQHLRALRFGSAEPFLLVDATQRAWVAEVSDRDGVLQLKGQQALSPPPLADLTLFTAWPKGKRAETLVTRSVEAGVSELVSVSCARSVAGKEKQSRNQGTRLERVARETAQQVGNPCLMGLKLDSLPLDELLALDPEGEKLMLHPSGMPLARLAPELNENLFSILVGPEGGFTDEEVERAVEAGWKSVGLGPLILRIEAAGPTAAALIQLSRGL